MEKIINDISDIVTSEINIINEKVLGLNFLELLKNNLIEKLSPIVSKSTYPMKKIINFEKEIKENSRNIKISINYFLNSLFETKKTVSNDSLFFSFNENTSLDIFDYKKKSTSILLYKNTGISIPKDTVINKQCNKNLLLIEIINKEKEQILTK